MPSTAKQILSLPFRAGLSQKEDPRWLEPGSMLTAQNAAHPKTNTLQKRAGHSKLTTSAVASGAGATTSIVTGRRLGTIGGLLLQVGADAWTDALWSYDEKSAGWDFIDRVPEVYALPARTVASQGTVIREVDEAICNGYRVITYLSPPQVTSVTGAGGVAGTNQVNNTGQVYVKVENAQTGEVVLPPQLIAFLPSVAYDQAAPKLIAQGQYVVLGVIAGPYTNLPGFAPPTSGSYSLYLARMDMTQPWKGFGPAIAIANITSPSAFDIRDVGAWDICATPGNLNTFGVVYQTGTAGSATLELSMLVTSSPPTILQTTSLNSGDPTYVTDGQQSLTAMSLDLGALASGNAAIAYGYRVASSGTTRIKMQVWQWAIGGTIVAFASDLVSQVQMPPVDAPHSIALSPPISGFTNTYKIAFAPRQAQWECQHPDGLTGAATAVTILMTVAPTLGVMEPVANSSPRMTWGVIPASRWLPNTNGIGYILCRLPSFEQGTHYLMADDSWQDFVSPPPVLGQYTDAFPMRVVATFQPRLSSSVISYGQVSPAPFVLSDQRTPHSLPHVSLNPSGAGTTVYESLITSSSVANVQDPTLVQWDMASAISYQNCELGTLTGIATGCPSLTDGARVHEFAFPYFPSIVSTTFVGQGGFAAGASYKWIVTYEWTDTKGQLHRSGRSSAIGGTVPATTAQDVLINVTGMAFSSKEKSAIARNPSSSPQGWGSTGPHVRIRLWRTQANGDVYYFVQELANITAMNSGQAVFVDSSADSLIARNPLLYGDGLDGITQGSILDNLTPPAFQALCVHKNRYFGVDGTNVWATKELVPGEGPGFNEAFAFSWDDTSDPITAIASLDDKLVLFKRNNVAIVTGEGPEDNGGQNDWSPPQVIATDLGAIDWRSVVVKADGVYFMSDAGLRSLTRDMQVVPVPQVEDALSANPSVTSAIVHPSAGRVSITSGAVRIDHNYVLECWTTAQTTNGDGSVSPISAVVADAPVSGSLVPTYHWLDATGAVWRESPSSYEDAGAFVPMQVETAWVKAEGIEGFARFRRLQVTWQNADPHALSVYVAYDYSPTYYLMGTVAAAQMTAMATPLCQVLFALPRQRAESVRFKLVDAQDSGTSPVTGQGPVLISMGLEVSTYTNRRTNRLPAAQRM